MKRREFFLTVAAVVAGPSIAAAIPPAEVSGGLINAPARNIHYDISWRLAETIPGCRNPGLQAGSFSQRVYKPGTITCCSIGSNSGIDWAKVDISINRKVVVHDLVPLPIVLRPSRISTGTGIEIKEGDLLTLTVRAPDPNITDVLVVLGIDGE